MNPCPGEVWLADRGLGGEVPLDSPTCCCSYQSNASSNSAPGFLPQNNRQSHHRARFKALASDFLPGHNLVRCRFISGKATVQLVPRVLPDFWLVTLIHDAFEFLTKQDAIPWTGQASTSRSTDGHVHFRSLLRTFCTGRKGPRALQRRSPASAYQVCRFLQAKAQPMGRPQCATNLLPRLDALHVPDADQPGAEVFTEVGLAADADAAGEERLGVEAGRDVEIGDRRARPPIRAKTLWPSTLRAEG